jgi:hypothetical protein
MRRLTGKWTVKPRLLGGYDILVQVAVQRPEFEPFYQQPTALRYEKAQFIDLVELNIVKPQNKK